MKHLILCLAALCCGCHDGGAPAPVTPRQSPQGNPAFPAPPGLTQRQINAWNVHTSSPTFKSIAIIPFDRSLVQSPSITLTIGGKAYVINGASRRYEGH